MRLLKYLCFLSLLALTVNSCKDACDDVDCGVNGTCVDGTCVCENGWSGDNCTTNICATANCGPNGTCDPVTGACDCAEGYSGANCEISVCDSVECGPNGICNPATGACDCEEGYSGASCEINVCDTVDCGPNGTCNTTTGECICDEGYEGTNCELEIRAKFIGIYQGDMTPCIPPIVALSIPPDQLELLETTELEVSESVTGVNFLNISATGDVLNLALETDIRKPNFDIPEFVQTVDLAGNEVTITGIGTGMYIEADTLQLDLMITYALDLATLNATCSPKFGKQ